MQGNFLRVNATKIEGAGANSPHERNSRHSRIMKASRYGWWRRRRTGEATAFVEPSVQPAGRQDRRETEMVDAGVRLRIAQMMHGSK
eukprot:6196398-Pleurochrysis_carterae.AAC.3